jgi:hypothetical protein
LLLPASTITLLVAMLAAFQPVATAASTLLDSVKQNPQLAQRLCSDFRQLNAQGKSATSKESLERVAASQDLSLMDAEILATYVIGLHCPDVR